MGHFDYCSGSVNQILPHPQELSLLLDKGFRCLFSDFSKLFLFLFFFCKDCVPFCVSTKVSVPLSLQSARNWQDFLKFLYPTRKVKRRKKYKEYPVSLNSLYHHCRESHFSPVVETMASISVSLPVNCQVELNPQAWFLRTSSLLPIMAPASHTGIMGSHPHSYLL